MCLSFENANAPFFFVATLASCLGQQVLYILNYFSPCDSSCYYFTYTIFFVESHNPSAQSKILHPSFMVRCAWKRKYARTRFSRAAAFLKSRNRSCVCSNFPPCTYDAERKKQDQLQHTQDNTQPIQKSSTTSNSRFWVTSSTSRLDISCQSLNRCT